MHLIEREADLAAAPAQVWLQNQQGIESQLLDAAQTRALEPALNKDVIAAVYCPKDGVADHSATTRLDGGGRACAGRRHTARMRASSGLTRRGERVVSLSAEINGEPVDVPVSEQVILLSNAHVGAFVAENLGLQLPIWRMLPQVMALRADIPPPMTHLIGHAHRTLAIKPLPDGRVMVSGGWRGRWDEATGRGVPIDEQVEGNRREAVAVYPALADLPVDEVYTDRAETVCADGIPIVDYLPGAENMLVGVGWSGHGWAIAPAVARLLAEWALSGERPRSAGAVWVWAVLLIHHRGTEGTEKPSSMLVRAAEPTSAARRGRRGCVKSPEGRRLRYNLVIQATSARRGWLFRKSCTPLTMSGSWRSSRKTNTSAIISLMGSCSGICGRDTRMADLRDIFFVTS